MPMVTATTAATGATTTTTLSTKGQVVIPRAMRDALAWPDGVTLVVEQQARGVLLVAAKHHFAPTSALSARGCMNYKGPALSLEEIENRLASSFAEKWRKGG